MSEIEIEICTLNGTKWILGDGSPEPMTWSGAKDWCESIGQELPPREVLLMAYLNPETRRKFASSYYWSSSEYVSLSAWSQYFNNGHQSDFNKHYALPVRAVRAIKDAGLKREPLTTDALEFLVDEYKGFPMSLCRAIEAAHGIGVDTNGN